MARDQAHHGRKQKPPIRWTLKQISEEFGLHQQSVNQKMRAAGIAASDDDACFSTKDCYKALIDPLSEQVKLAQIEKDKKSAAYTDVRTKTLLKENVPVAIVEKVWSDFMVDLRQKIQNLDIPAKDRNDILADLQTIPGLKIIFEHGKMKEEE